MKIKRLESLEWIQGVESEYAKTDAGTYFLSLDYDDGDHFFSCKLVDKMMIGITIFEWLPFFPMGYSSAKEKAEEHWQSQRQLRLID